MERNVIQVERSGEWMPVEELKESTLKMVREDKDLILNLNKLEHLDASALQVLLALDIEQKKRGRHLHLVNATAPLLRWFDYSGSANLFFMTGQQIDE